MTLKNSFLASLKENNKRRIWLWLVSVLTFLFAFPVCIVIILRREIQNITNYAEAMGIELTEKMVHTTAAESLKECIGLNETMFIFVAVMAVISAVQGFSYLYNKKKIDFYMGMPVKRKRRFFVIWLNGILAFALPYLAGLILCLVIGAVNGGVTALVLAAAGTAFLINLCFYLGVYHVALLAVMLTGNLIVTGFAMLVFFLYELVVRTVLIEFESLFFRFFSYHGVRDTAALSPFTMYFKFESSFMNNNAEAVKAVIEMLLFAALTLLLSYFCYLRRPAEAAGKAMAFQKTRSVVKIAVTVPLSLAAGLIFGDMVGFSPLTSMEGIGFVLFAMVIAVIFISCLMQVIYEFDIRGIFHKKAHIVISGVGVAVVFMIFSFDLFGYDSYLPPAEKLESVAFVPEGMDGNISSNSYFDENMHFVSDVDYAEERMFLTDVESVRRLAEISMEASLQTQSLVSEYTDTDEREWSRAAVIYRLKNGRKVSRSFYVNVKDETSAGLLDKIMGSSEYKTGYYMALSDDFLDLLLDDGGYKIETIFGNTVYNEKMSREEAKGLLNAYKKDMEQLDFTSQKENLPLALLQINVVQEYNRYTSMFPTNLVIYPFFQESIAFLKEHGYYSEGTVKTEDIERIQITNINSEIYEKLVEKQNAGTEAGAAAAIINPANAMTRIAIGDSELSEKIDTTKYADYTEQDKIAEIAKKIYPAEIAQNGGWCHRKKCDYDYRVTVYFKAGSFSAKNCGISAEYSFLTGEVPGFVEEDTAYR